MSISITNSDFRPATGSFGTYECCKTSTFTNGFSKADGTQTGSLGAPVKMGRRLFWVCLFAFYFICAKSARVTIACGCNGIRRRHLFHCRRLQQPWAYHLDFEWRGWLIDWLAVAAQSRGVLWLATCMSSKRGKIS